MLQHEGRPVHELTIAELGAAYRTGDITPLDATAHFLKRIEAGPADVYRKTLPERALEQARRATEAFAAGRDAGPLQGIPLALKDNIGLAGEVAAAGSAARLRHILPEQHDSTVAARLDAAGAVFLGYTNMTELAFSGLGLNPHFGTPGSAVDPARVPGGSSGGSAAAVGHRLATAAVGTDTGGSVRVPATFNGVIGFKCTDGAIPTEGVVPLSTTLDTVGPLAHSVDDARILFVAMAGPDSTTRDPGARHAGEPLPPRLSFLVPTTVLMDGLEPEVEESFRAAAAALRAAGHEVTEAEAPLLAEAAALSGKYGHPGAYESLVLHADLLDVAAAELDQRVLQRLRLADGRLAADYLGYLYGVQRLRREFWPAVAGFHAVLAPAVATLPPLITAVEASHEAFFAANSLALRNTSLFNLLGGPALTLPGSVPMTGIMIATAPGSDAFNLSLGERVAELLSPVPSAPDPA